MNQENSNNKRISVQESSWIDISVPPEMIPEFKQLVRRSISTWQDISPEMRRFADKLLGQEDIMKTTYDTGRGKLKENDVVQKVRVLCTDCWQLPCICACTAA